MAKESLPHLLTCNCRVQNENSGCLHNEAPRDVKPAHVLSTAAVAFIVSGCERRADVSRDDFSEGPILNGRAES